MVNPNLLSNIPDEQHPTQQKRVQELLQYLNQSLLQNDLFSAYNIQRVLHKELLTSQNKESLEQLRKDAAQAYTKEYAAHQQHRNYYSSEYQYHMEAWELTLRDIAQRRGLM